MSWPLFPQEVGVPGNGSFVTVISGSPATELSLNGIIDQLLVIDAQTLAGISWAAPSGRFGEPLHHAGTTIWLKGRLLLGLKGQPLVSDVRELWAAWANLRNKLLSGDPYELRLYAVESPHHLHYAYAGLRSALVQSFWHQSAGMQFTLGAHTEDSTLRFSEVEE